MPSLIHSTLGITSLLKRQPLKHNVIDRDKIAVPPNWDSWGKIRVLGGTFEAETVSQGWEEDIDEQLGSSGPCSMDTLEQNRQVASETAEPIQTESAIARYEDWCQEPGTSGGLAVVEGVMNETDVAIHSEDTQEFLEGQLKILEAFKAKADTDKVATTAGTGASAAAAAAAASAADREHISEHIGPVQFNVGGIQVDADDMLQRIKVCTPLPSTTDQDGADCTDRSTRTATRTRLQKTQPARRTRLSPVSQRNMTMSSCRTSLAISSRRREKTQQSNQKTKKTKNTNGPRPPLQISPPFPFVTKRRPWPPN